MIDRGERLEIDHNIARTRRAAVIEYTSKVCKSGIIHGCIRHSN
ncbi:MAG: hypothetical protein QOK44_2487 [Betaproteobacteria bacterium]|nr:hypothetical protein [Betaproteobacteria bacterium]